MELKFRKVPKSVFALLLAAGTVATLGTAPAAAAEPSIVSINDVLRQQTGLDLSPVDGIWRGFTTDRLVSTDSTVSPVGEPSLSLGDTVYMGTSTLKNTTDSTVTMSTQVFSQAVTDSLTTTVTHGVGTAAKVSAAFKLSDVLSVGGDVTTTYSFSKATSQTATTTNTYTAPQQNIAVPPHTNAIVNVNLKRIKATGKVDISTKLSGHAAWVPCQDRKNDPCLTDAYYTSPSMDGVDLYNTINQAQSSKKTLRGTPTPALPAGFYLTNDKKLGFEGTGTYSANYGADLEVKVSFAPNDVEAAAKSAAPGTAATAPFTKSYTVPVTVD
ncbi:ETX/MTX2 family pore-forming toxin [Streptomyces sp. I6]|uniref:ETX/MTX2 family pore-forming toxin n=1 Tax=Streptomyces sp. I6 TaxID=2483113 RepID=UPI00161771BA|nr:ETX/MTX2 family pore-forming toxin [Streptomyces sp. I6]